MAVGVVGGGALAELREPAGQVGRVLAQRVDELLRAVERRGSCAGRRSRSAARAAAACAVRSIRSLFLPGRADQLAQVADRRAAASATSGRSARRSVSQLLGVRAWTRPPARPRRRAPRAGSRTSCCALRSVVGQQPERARRAPRSRRRSRRTRCSRCPPAGVSSPRRSAIAPIGLRGVDQEALEHRVVGDQLAGQPRRGVQRRAEVLERLRAPASALPRYWSAWPWMNFCRPARVLGSSVLKSWSRSTGADGVVGRDLPAVVDLGRVVRARARAPRSGWRCPTATSRGSWPSCPGAAASSSSSVTVIFTTACELVVQLDAVDRADRPAADVHLVALHQLAAVLERRR